MSYSARLLLWQAYATPSNRHIGFPTTPTFAKLTWASKSPLPHPSLLHSQPIESPSTSPLLRTRLFSSPLDLLAFSVIAPRAHKAYHDAAQRKFTSRSNNLLITHNINQAGIMTLLPFTVDLFGQVGHFFHRFLYPNDTINPYPDAPPWLDPTDFPNYSAHQAFLTAVQQPSVLPSPCTC